MTNFSDVSSLCLLTKTNKREAQQNRGRVTVLIIVLLIIVTFIAVTVGITLSYVTQIDITRLHVLFSVPNNDTIIERGRKTDEQTGTVFCDKITQAIYSANWTGHFITCRSTVFRNELDELHCSIVLDCFSCRQGTNDVDNIKQIVIRVIEGSSGGSVKSVDGESVKHRPYTTKDRPNTTNDRPNTTKDRPNTTKDRPNTTKDRPNTTKDRPNTTKDTEPLTKLTTGVLTQSGGQHNETVPHTSSPSSQTTRFNDITENMTERTTRTRTDLTRWSSTESSTESSDSDMNSWDKLFSKIMKHNVSFV